MGEFVHLHVHSEYSLLDGACRLDRLIDRAKELGQDSLAITDHGVMYGAVDFYKTCKAKGVKPIIGCETYVAPRTRFDKQHKIDTSPYHLVLLCKNMQGYQNLIKLVSMGYIDGFYNRPRIDRELLERHSEGLVALSACLAGEIPRALTAGDYESAKEVALYYRGIFGEDYYIEIQNHGIREQVEILPMLARLSRETGIPMVATNDCHYLRKDDNKMQNVLVCIATNRTVQEGSDMEFATDQFYLKSADEMRELFAQYEGAVENTVKIAAKCDMDFTFGETKLPHFIAPDGITNEDYFRRKCYDGLQRLYGDTPAPEIKERLDFELSVIEKMGYVDYFLIVHDFIDHARSKGIPVGPGRGSGAGSLAAYCVGITGIDPIKYNLLFERFLNPERVSMPDFDIDFCYERRGEVIDYVVDKYGSDHVAQIITFGTMAARGSLRDVGRALGMSYQSVDTIAKLVPFELGMTLGKAKDVSPDLRAAYESDPQTRELLDMAQKIEGMARHASTHAAGVVITREPADHYVPLQKNEQSIVTQYPMGTLEELGLLKMDFLGLRNLTVISDAQKMISRFEPDFNIESIPVDDPGVFKMLSAGQSNGVFQFESNGMKNVLTSLKPEHMEDLIAVISLYRPGPMDSIPTYVRNRHNPKLVTYKTPMLEPILKVTYGCIVYQEQVMQICRELAGYSYGRADLVRRAMSKKKADVMQQERQNFVHGALRADGSVECVGAVANGIPEHIANEIFDEMSSFASYAFNKSHAAAYALLAYQTAYLKLHYPKEYMAALLTSVLDFTEKVIDYIGEARKMGIQVNPPSIVESEMGFTVVGESIRFGLLAVKNIGRGFIGELIAERKNGNFKDLLDFVRRLHGKELNRRTLESLIKCGAIDGFGHGRRQMLVGMESLLESVDKDARNNVSGQMDLFAGSAQQTEAYALPAVEEFELMQLLAYEKETTGLYISGHPLDAYTDTIKQLRATSFQTILTAEDMDTAGISTVCIITGKKLKTTKSGDMMAFMALEDLSGQIEMIVFPKSYAAFGPLLNVGATIGVRARVKAEDDDTAKLICEEVVQPEQIIDAVRNAPQRNGGSRAYTQRNGAYAQGNEAPPQYAQVAVPAKPAATEKHGLYLKFPEKTSPLIAKSRLCLDVFEGATPVYFYYSDTKKYEITPSTYWISENDVLIKELKSILGEQNVAFIN